VHVLCVKTTFLVVTGDPTTIPPSARFKHCAVSGLRHPTLQELKGGGKLRQHTAGCAQTAKHTRCLNVISACQIADALNLYVITA
jgi:hypothetical protein